MMKKWQVSLLFKMSQRLCDGYFELTVLAFLNIVPKSVDTCTCQEPTLIDF